MDSSIESGTLYSLATFKSRMRLGDRALRSARRDGLKIHRVGGRAFVLGADVIEWLRSRSANSDGDRNDD